MSGYHSDSYKPIKLSRHSIIRAEQRLGIASTNEIRKLAFAARRKGIKVWLLDKSNKAESGLDDNTYYLLKSKICTNKHGNGNVPYYYKGNVFIFYGKWHLITIIPLDMLKEESREFEKLS